MSHLFLDTFSEFVVVEKFAFVVIFINTSIGGIGVSQYELVV